jgi:hypothetical protein
MPPLGAAQGQIRPSQLNNGQTFIIINDAQLALELLRDRSAAHAARPHMVFSSDMYVHRVNGSVANSNVNA